MNGLGPNEIDLAPHLSEEPKDEREGTFEEALSGWGCQRRREPILCPKTPPQPLPSEERTPDKGYIYGTR